MSDSDIHAANWFLRVRPGAVMVRAWHSRLKRSRGQFPTVLPSGNNLGQVVHTHVPLSSSSIFGTGQRAVMFYGWGGNRRSGVAPAMRHKLKWFMHRQAHGLRKGDIKHLACTTGMAHFAFTSLR